MNKAVEARLQNPDLPYLDALIAGGFVFPKLHAPGKKPSEARDTEDVTLAQRKNQLMRRLRAVKKNQASIIGDEQRPIANESRQPTDDTSQTYDDIERTKVPALQYSHPAVHLVRQYQKVYHHRG